MRDKIFVVFSQLSVLMHLNKITEINSSFILKSLESSNYSSINFYIFISAVQERLNSSKIAVTYFKS